MFFVDLLAVPLSKVYEIWGVYSTSSASPVLCAAALPRGTKVGPKGRSITAQITVCLWPTTPRFPFGPWLHVKQAYLGLKFVLQGQTHFGWARVKLSISDFNRSITATLTGYAYETIPGKPIIAGATKGPDDAEPAASVSTPIPEPATQGELALGAPGLSIWGRKETQEVIWR